MKAQILMTLVAIIMTTQYKSVECAKKMDINGLRDMLKPMSSSCKKKTGVSEELIAGTHNGNFPKDKNLMCYFRCLSIMVKVMDKKFNIVPENVEKQINILVQEDLAPRLIEIGRRCFEQVPKLEDSCEYAFEMVVCGYNIDKSVYFLP